MGTSRHRHFRYPAVINGRKGRFPGPWSGKIVRMTAPGLSGAAVLALHWQGNMIKREGFCGGLPAEPVARSGVVNRAAGFHAAARGAGVELVFTRFTVPV